MRYHLTLKSRNTKTGPIPASTTSADSCPPACPLRDAGCYAAKGPLALFWGRLTEGTVGTGFAEFLASVSGLAVGTLWRHNQAGDLPGEGDAIDAGELGELVRANAGKRGFTYTHKAVSIAANRAAIAAANRDGFTVNLSANNITHADELAALGIAPVVTVLPIEYGRRERRVSGRVQWAETLGEYRARIAALPKVTPAGRPISVCPATYLDSNCQGCKGLCQRQARDSVVGFPAHGADKAKASAIARAA
jgi:hypothetical protein